MMIFRSLIVILLFYVMPICGQDYGQSSDEMCDELDTICRTDYMYICRERMMTKALQVGYSEEEAKRLLVVLKVFHDVLGVQCARFDQGNAIGFVIKGIIAFALVSKNHLCGAVSSVSDFFKDLLEKVGVQRPKWEKFNKFKRFVCEGRVDDAADPDNPTEEEVGVSLWGEEYLQAKQAQESAGVNSHKMSSISLRIFLVVTLLLLFAVMV